MLLFNLFRHLNIYKMKTNYILFFFFYLISTNIKSQSSDFLSNLDSAYYYYDSLNYSKSKDFFLKLTNFDECRSKDYFYLSSCYSNLNKVDSGFIYLEKAIEYGWNYSDTSLISKDIKIINLTKSKNFAPIKIKLILLTKNKISIDTSLQNYFYYLRDRDQKYRKLSTDSMTWLKQEKLDLENQMVLDSFIKVNGWPRLSIHGEDVVRIAWLIAQHADNNISFQLKCLENMKKLFKYNEISLSNYAYLFDRIQINSCKEQVYGTQYSILFDENNSFKSIEFKPISESKLVNKRRRYMNLPSLDSYRKTAENRYRK